jgi:hypothetical protein
MGPSQKWINQRAFAEQLVARWEKSLVASDDERFRK